MCRGQHALDGEERGQVGGVRGDDDQCEKPPDRADHPPRHRPIQSTCTSRDRPPQPISAARRQIKLNSRAANPVKTYDDTLCSKLTTKVWLWSKVSQARSYTITECNLHGNGKNFEVKSQTGSNFTVCLY